MPPQITPENLSLLSAAILALLLASYIWNRRSTPGITPLLLLLFSNLLWAGSAAIEAVVQTPAAKVFWLKIGVSSASFLPLAWLLFVIYYSEHASWLKWRTKALLSLPPLLSILLIWTNELHFLYWKPTILAEPLLQSSAAPFGPGLWICSGVTYLYLLASAILLAQVFFKPGGQNKLHTGILLICTFTPWLFHISYLLFKPLWGVKDLTLYAYNLTQVFFVYALFRFRLLNIIPIAFETMIEGMGDGLIVITPQKQIVQINPAAERIIQRQALEVIGKPAKEAFAHLPNLIEKCCTSELEMQEEIALPGEGGEVFYEMHLSPLLNRRKHLIGRLMVLRNISKRVEAEQASRESQAQLARSEEIYRHLVENIQEIIFVLDMSGSISYISPGAERYMGFQSEEMIGRAYKTFIYAEDFEKVSASLKRTLEGANPSCDFRVIGKSGVVRYMRGQYNRLFQEGRLVGLQGMLTDITESRRAEEMLERRLSQLAMLNRIGEKIAAVMDLDSILDSATYLIYESFHYHHVGLYTPDEACREVTMRSVSGAFSEVFPKGHRLKYEQGMVGWVAQHQSVLLTNDVVSEPRYTNLYPDKITTGSELTVPILSGNELVGVLDIQSPKVNAFDENDVRAIKTVADQMAVAIENARLYEEVRLQLKRTGTQRKYPAHST